jgi:hypothetical protein
MLFLVAETPETSSQMGIRIGSRQFLAAIPGAAARTLTFHARKFLIRAPPQV